MSPAYSFVYRYSYASSILFNINFNQLFNDKIDDPHVYYRAMKRLKHGFSYINAVLNAARGPPRL